MASGAGQSAADAGLQQFLALINTMFGGMSDYSSVAGAAFKQFFGNEGVFSNPLFGQQGTEQLLQQLQGFRDTTLPGLMGNVNNMPAYIQNLMGQTQTGMDRSMNIINNGGQTGQSSDIRNYLMNILNGTSGDMPAISQFANNTLQNGGMTTPMYDNLDAARELMKNGGMNAALGNLQDVGGGIVSRMGYGPETQGAMDFYSKIMAAGGRDAGTQQLMNSGQNLLNSGGMTGDMSKLMGLITQGMQNGGMTPEARQLFGKAMEIVNNNGQGGALLPTDSVISMARNQAATASSQQAEAVRRSAMQRQGAAVGSGGVEQVMAEMADQAARGESSAVTGAAMGQQDLQLKQLLGAMGIGDDLTKTASSLLGQYAGAGADITRSASANMGTGADLMKSAEQLAAERFSQANTGFNNTIGNTLSRLNLGSQMVTGAQTGANQRMGMGLDTNQNVAGLASGNVNNAMQQLLGLISQQNAAGSNLNNLTGLEFGRESDAFKNLYAGAGLNNSMFTGQQGVNLQSNAMNIDAILKSLGLSSDMTSNFTNQWMNAGNGMTNISQLYSSLLPSLFNGYTGMTGDKVKASMQPGFWNQIGQQFFGSLFQGLGGGLTGGLSSILSGGGPKGGGPGVWV